MKLRLFAVLLVMLIGSNINVAGQNGCTAPALAPSKTFNMFTQEQDVLLGEVFAESMALDNRIIEDAVLTSYLQQVGDRVAKHFPPNQLKFRFFVIDAPFANAFALPGGRVYVTRKLISQFKSEDELAGVLAHEMGHQVARHGALDWSKRFRDIVKVQKISTRADIEDAYHKFLETYRITPSLLRDDGREDKEQLQADEVAVYAAAQAGYRPAATVEFWDRFTESKGKKGSWFSDVFGSTTPEMKRLREFVNNVQSLPEKCVDKYSGASADEFAKWQTAVRKYSGFGKKMEVKNVVAKRELTPPLRGDIQFLRFSPDGKYLLAQDDASIFVLSKEPFKTLFRIDAEDAYDAQFSPDSKQVIFHTEALRVERWNIADKSLDRVDDVHIFRSCRQTELSPDGKVLACLRPDRQTFFPMELALVDVEKDEQIFSKKEFVGPADYGWNAFFSYWKLASWKGNIINMHFSPDGKYFLAGTKIVNLGFDVNAKAQMSLPGSVKKVMGTNFAFLGPDRIIGVEGDQGEKSVIVSFPKGDTVASNIPIGNRSVTSPGHGDFVIVRPLLKAPVGIFDIKQGKITIGSRSDAIDIYDGIYVGERVSGELGLFAEPGKPPVATAVLPPAPLARLHASGMSPDDKLLAISDRARGALWDITTGEQLFFLRGFRGVDFDSSAVTLDFPPADAYDSPGAAKQKAKEVEKEKREKPGHSIARFDLARRDVTEGDKFLQKERVIQAGKWLIVMKSGKEDEDDYSKNATVVVKNVRTGQQAWTRKYEKEMPDIYYDPASELALFEWELTTGGAKDELHGDAEAKRRADAIINQERSSLVEIVDLGTGKIRSRFPVDTGKGSFRLADALVMNDRVYFSDTNDRVLVFNDKGDLLGRFFGKLRNVSANNKLMLLETERGRLALYDVASRNKLDVLTFESPIGFARFSNDGKKIFVLTRDQKLYTVSVPQTVAQVN